MGPSLIAVSTLLFHSSSLPDELVIWQGGTKKRAPVEAGARRPSDPEVDDRGRCGNDCSSGLYEGHQKTDGLPRVGSGCFLHRRVPFCPKGGHEAQVPCRWWHRGRGPSRLPPTASTALPPQVAAHETPSRPAPSSNVLWSAF